MAFLPAQKPKNEQLEVHDQNCHGKSEQLHILKPIGFNIMGVFYLKHFDIKCKTASFLTSKMQDARQNNLD